MGRTFRTMSTQTLMPRHVHNKDPLSKYAHADPLQAHRGRSRSSSGSSSRRAPGHCAPYIYVYTHLARSRSWPLCFAASTLAYLIFAPLLSLVISNIWVAIALWLLVWVILQRTAVPFDKDANLPVAPKWDLPMRIISALTLIFLVTGFSNVLGASLSGALAMYPVMTSIMSSFNHARFGANSAIAFLNGLGTYLVFVGLIFFPLLLIVT